MAGKVDGVLFQVGTKWESQKVPLLPKKGLKKEPECFMGFWYVGVSSLVLLWT